MSRSLLILVVIGVYLLALLLVSHFASRGADSSTFFVGNRKMPWPIVAIAMICAPISGITFISVPGMVMTKGYTYLQMCLGFIAGYLVIATVLLPVFYRYRAVSIYSFLETRFGNSTYKTGAWMFLISKILGTSVKFFVICIMLQMLVFDAFSIPFPVTVAVTIAMIWFYTVRGGVKAVIWTDLLKCTCLIVSVALCIYFIADSLHLGWGNLIDTIGEHPNSQMFNFDRPMEESYFWKQFIAGVFMVVAMTGLDQDMMQHALSCRDARSSMKNMIVSSVMQFVVITLFLFLGTLLLVYAESSAVELPEKSDSLFATVAFHDGLPVAVGILFILGLVSATYSSIGSALTSLTTSFTVDVMEAHRKLGAEELSKKRKTIHTVIAAVMALSILAFYYLSRQDAISAVFTLASYTYGPILGLFAFGLFSQREVNSRWLPAVCIASPVFCWFLQWGASRLLEYETGFELLLVNAAFTIIGLLALSTASGKSVTEQNAELQ